MRFAGMPANVQNPMFDLVQKSKTHTLEQYLTVLQEAQVESLTGALNGSFGSTQAKQLSHASTADLLR